MTDKIYQEFYCAKSGGGCGGYILVQINTELNGVVGVVCPKCGHEHRRNIKGGRIIEQGRYDVAGKPTERLRPLITAWSKKPATKTNHATFKNGQKPDIERDAVIISARRDLLRERWFEIHGVALP